MAKPTRVPTGARRARDSWRAMLGSRLRAAREWREEEGPSWSRAAPPNQRSFGARARGSRRPQGRWARAARREVSRGPSPAREMGARGRGRRVREARGSMGEASDGESGRARVCSVERSGWGLLSAREGRTGLVARLNVCRDERCLVASCDAGATPSSRPSSLRSVGRPAIFSSEREALPRTTRIRSSSKHKRSSKRNNAHPPPPPPHSTHLATPRAESARAHRERRGCDERAPLTRPVARSSR